MSFVLNQQLVTRLRAMAHDDRLPSEMLRAARMVLGSDGNVLNAMIHFRAAFCLSLGEAKPLCGLPRSDAEPPSPALDGFLTEAIRAHWDEWNPLQEETDA